ncbi:MAG TPA: PD-(D/E)XK nuclease family protein [Actinomycetota bacterium]|jgi:RecB family exonuclease|nr:PD-(D/E)XK nuclease family protein [Actinomycetota bacterium]
MRLSYSSINTYETCPAKFRFQYEDRLPQAASPALAFGDSLHRALHLFHARPVPVAPSLPDLLEMLDLGWVSDGFANVSEEQAYRDHGRQVLTQYHHDNAGSYRIPAASEFRFQIQIDGIQVSGVLDRMDRIPGGGYEIIDYKTNRRLPPRSRIDQDLQLSIYHLAAQQVWGIEPERLTLYYLLPGQRMTTTRSRRDLEQLRRRIAVVAERIGAGKFEPRQNPLCDWCDYQALCPLFRHRFEREHGDPAPRMTEVVDEWIALKRQGRAVYRRLDELAGLINAFGDEHGYRRLFGSDGAAIDRRVQHVTAPDEHEVRRILEPLGLWEQILSVDPAKLNALVESRALPPDIEDRLLASREEVRTQHALYLRESEPSRR